MMKNKNGIYNLTSHVPVIITERMLMLSMFYYHDYCTKLYSISSVGGASAPPPLSMPAGTHVYNINNGRKLPKLPWYLLTSALDSSVVTWLLPAIRSCYFITVSYIHDELLCK